MWIWQLTLPRARGNVWADLVSVGGDAQGGVRRQNEEHSMDSKSKCPPAPGGTPWACRASGIRPDCLSKEQPQRLTALGHVEEFARCERKHPCQVLYSALLYVILLIHMHLSKSFHEHQANEYLNGTVCTF